MISTLLIVNLIVSVTSLLVSIATAISVVEIMKSQDVDKNVDDQGKNDLMRQYESYKEFEKSIRTIGQRQIEIPQRRVRKP